MPIPHFDDLRQPTLAILSDGKIRKKSDLILPLQQHFKLSDEEISQEYESGNGAIFPDRISWVLSYFAMTGLLDRPRRGYYVINDLGRKYSKKSSEEIIEYVKQKMMERGQGKQKCLKPSLDDAQTDTVESTPQERLYNSYQDIRQVIYDEILDTILSKSPVAFERLVVELLQKMGYGGTLDKPGRVTRQSRDGGIDGEIREDVLGLGRIHIQAKCYQREKTIGRPEIQSFAGALLGSNANKGVFITTAQYTDDAKKYAETIPNARIILIDGNKLAEYIYQYGLGMQVEQTIVIKKLDTDYWDEIPNNTNSKN